MGKLYMREFFVDKQMRHDRRLIHAIKDCPALYDKGHQHYNDLETRNAHWLDISNKLKIDNRKVERRFIELLHKYREEKSKRNYNTPIWPLYHHMEYFDDFDLIPCHRPDPGIDISINTLLRYIKRIVEETR